MNIHDLTTHKNFIAFIHKYFLRLIVCVDKNEKAAMLSEVKHDADVLVMLM